MAEVDKLRQELEVKDATIDELTEKLRVAEARLNASTVQPAGASSTAKEQLIADAKASQAAVAVWRTSARMYQRQIEQLKLVLLRLTQHPSHEYEWYARWVEAPVRMELEALERMRDNAEKTGLEIEADFVERRDSAQRAMLPIMRRDAERYEQSFDELLRDPAGATACQQIRLRLQTWSAQYKGLGAVRQPRPPAAPTSFVRSAAYVDQLYCAAAVTVRERGALRVLASRLASECGGEASVPPLKGRSRTLQKTKEKYMGDFSRMLDIARAMVVFERAEDLERALALIDTMCADAHSSLKVVRHKDRLTTAFDAAVESGGYRDVLLNLSSSISVDDGADAAEDGYQQHHVFELQLHLRRFYKIKRDGGHQHYKDARTLHMLDSVLTTRRLYWDVAGADPTSSEEHEREAAVAETLDEVAVGTVVSLVLDHSPALAQGVDGRQQLLGALRSPACSVRELSLVSCKIDDAFLRDLWADSSSSSPSLQLRRICLGEASISEVNDGLSATSGELIAAQCGGALTEVDLNHCCGGVGGGLLSSIFSPISFSASRALLLTKLGLEDTCLKSTNAVKLGKAMEDGRLPNLVYVNLYNNALGKDAGCAIARGLARCPLLRVLIFGENEFGPDAMKLLQLSLEGPERFGSVLAHLNFSKCGLMEAGGLALAGAIANGALPELRKLSVHCNDIGEIAAEALGKALALKKCPHLHQLRVSFNAIGVRGGEALATAALRGAFTSLEILSSEKNDMGSGSATILAQAIAEDLLPAIKILNLHSNKFGSSAEVIASAAAAKLGKCPALVQLHLGDELGGLPAAYGMAIPLTAETRSEYIERTELRKLCEWITTEIVLQRPSDPLQHMHELLGSLRRRAREQNGDDQRCCDFDALIHEAYRRVGLIAHEPAAAPTTVPSSADALALAPTPIAVDELGKTPVGGELCKTPVVIPGRVPTVIHVLRDANRVLEAKEKLVVPGGATSWVVEVAALCSEQDDKARSLRQKWYMIDDALVNVANGLFLDAPCIFPYRRQRGGPASVSFHPPVCSSVGLVVQDHSDRQRWIVDGFLLRHSADGRVLSCNLWKLGRCEVAVAEASASGQAWGFPQLDKTPASAFSHRFPLTVPPKLPPADDEGAYLHIRAAKDRGLCLEARGEVVALAKISPFAAGQRWRCIKFGPSKTVLLQSAVGGLFLDSSVQQIFVSNREQFWESSATELRLRPFATDSGCGCKFWVWEVPRVTRARHGEGGLSETVLELVDSARYFHGGRLLRHREDGRVLAACDMDQEAELFVVDGAMASCDKSSWVAEPTSVYRAEYEVASAARAKKRREEAARRERALQQEPRFVCCGCFHEDSLVLMADGGLKRCAEVVRGDRVSCCPKSTTPGVHSAEVLCVVKTPMPSNAGKVSLVRMPASAPEQGGTGRQLLVTPWHPTRVKLKGEAEAKWRFPATINEARSVAISCKAVFTFVLRCGHVVNVDGVECVTLGHELRAESEAERRVLSHPYFGTAAVLDDLRSMRGWEDGLVVLEQNSVPRRDARGTGRVVALTQ